MNFIKRNVLKIVNFEKKFLKTYRENFLKNFLNRRNFANISLRNDIFENFS